MTFSRYEWINDSRLVIAALCLVGFGVLGPGLFGLAPPKWHLRDVVETVNETAVPPVFGEEGVSSKGATTRLRGPNTADLINSRPSFEATGHYHLLAERIPPSHLTLSGTTQKQSFIDLVLPLITAANEEIDARRQAIIHAYDRDDRPSLEKWAKLYKIPSDALDDDALYARLLHRADKVPVPIALAQAAIESGWGTSRFAREGNALFGQWAWRESAGIRPLEAEDDRFVVRSFGTLFDSVRAYIHNLNTHRHYADFRSTRADVRALPVDKRTDRLVAHLDSYAEIGMAYVEKLRRLIRSNDFYRYGTAWL